MYCFDNFGHVASLNSSLKTCFIMKLSSVACLYLSLLLKVDICLQHSHTMMKMVSACGTFN